MRDSFLQTLASKTDLEKVIPALLKLKPKDAIKFLKEKGFLITWDWREQLALNHEAVFTVAKATKMDILKDIREMLQKSIDEGLPFATFQEELTPMLQAKGWWGRKIIKGKSVQLGSPWRLKTIYDTNVQSSYNAGRWKAQEDNKASRPFLRYISSEDQSVRPAHRALNGTVKPVDDPFWKTYYPPNGYNCRCSVRAFTKEQAKKSGITKGIPTFKDKKGKTLKAKPDTGFSNNPGRSKWTPKKSDYPADIWRLGNG